MQLDQALLGQSQVATVIAGVDEAGRGPLAGDVVAAAVILDLNHGITFLNDSKKLSAQRRQDCFAQLQCTARSFAVGRASVAEIDDLNILQASLLAMRRAVEALTVQPDLVYVDGNRCPVWRYPSQALVGGDGLLSPIAAASVLAKVVRDQEMEAMDKLYPEYGFSQHKGYPTRAHLTALQKYGPCPIHRRSFKPVATLLEKS